ncbi:MAG: MaoC family dehydratase [Proteobacteria bacterium]|nr:MaoC family dehydratase [Pseudomonadota bacterium]
MRLTEAEISAFASAAGDANPLHHDREYAANSQYGGIVASGPHTGALLMGLVATHFSRFGSMVGLEFTFLFRAAVPADDDLTLEWLVIRVEPKRRGSLVELRGRLRTSSGVTAVGAKGKVLVSEAAQGKEARQ